MHPRPVKNGNFRPALSNFFKRVTGGMSRELIGDRDEAINLIFLCQYPVALDLLRIEFGIANL